MHATWSSMKAETNRRSFLKNGLTAAGIATASLHDLAEDADEPDEGDKRVEQFRNVVRWAVSGGLCSGTRPFDASAR
jgi:hypothetical protein